MTLHEKPPAATHWSARTLAKALGISHTSVQRIWNAHGLKPHLVKTFKLSNDKRFVEKVKDVVGLYLDPPDKALVFSVDEKSQIQALDRTQPGLPMKKGRAGTMTHDYKRNGTTTLFAALNIATGRVIGQCMKRHRHQEWLKFLRTIDRNSPQGLDLHLIADNYATHKHAKVKAWLKRHPRFHMHFTPTSASWLNQVERFFGRITVDRIRRGVFKSVAELETAIQQYLDHHNAEPKPFVWTASAAAILEKVARGRQVLEVGTLASGEYGDVYFGLLPKTRKHLNGPPLSTRASLHARPWSEVDREARQISCPSKQREALAPTKNCVSAASLMNSRRFIIR